MIFFISENNFLSKKMYEIFDQKNLINKVLKNENSIEVDFSIQGNLLTTKLKKNFFSVKIPISFTEYFIHLKKSIVNYEISYNEISYFPFKQEIFYQGSSSNLGEIHNKLILLLLFSVNGVSRFDLYKAIWPNEKTLQMNKLDTHITNLKKILFTDLGLKIKINSTNGIIKIID